MSTQGLRCLAIAESPINENHRLAGMNDQNKGEYLADINKYGEYESEGVFLGIICIKDPIREEVKGAIRDCKIAGIRVIMITGDSKETAVAIAKELDIIEQG